MQIRPISQLLAAAGLGFPKINALTPDVNNFKLQLMQPKGDIVAGAFGVRSRDRALATAQFGSFLITARKQRADLAVTPEYSMPWDVLAAAIEDGSTLRPGDLWILGCESITYEALSTLKERLSPHCEIICETLQPEQGRFLDPLVYLFWAPTVAAPEEAKLVLVVQFKTYPMSEPGHFEVSGMQRGTCIYEFDRQPDSIRLVTLICSDVLDFLDSQAQQVYSDALIIHLQLNPDPRHVEFRSYRDRLMRYPGDQTELVCLNWASNVSCQLGDTPKKQWGNIAGSAWYLRPDKFDDSDAALLQNHKRGLYYTWLRPDKFHALFFNYDPSVFILEASKVFHHAVAGVISRRRGPQILSTLTWDGSASSWISGPDPNDGFALAAQDAGDALGNVQALAAVNPLHAERVLALAAGKAGPDTNWYRPKLLDSCAIERSEVIKRMTFCQDNSSDAAEFRTQRFRRIKEIVRILKDERLPAFLSDFKDGFTLEWSSAHAQQNAKSSSGQYATVIYMGEDAGMPAIERAYVNAADNLHKTSRDADESTALKQRLALWYRDGGQLKIFREHHYTAIDKPSGVSEVEFTRSGT